MRGVIEAKDIMIADRDQQIEKATQAAVQLQDQKKAVEEQLREIQTELNGIRIRLNRAISDLDTKNLEISQLKSLRDKFSDDIVKLEKEIIGLNADAILLRDQVADKEIRNSQLAQEQLRLRDELKT
jgi:chromosome segregation ATPase